MMNKHEEDIVSPEKTMEERDSSDNQHDKSQISCFTVQLDIQKEDTSALSAFV